MIPPGLILRFCCIAKSLRFPKLQRFTISAGTPTLSSSSVKGQPRNSANLVNVPMGSSNISSYFKNSTLPGVCVFSFQ
ncbi:hypothetical protein C4D60_Mb04t14150 [Musa balbisiana]|uniref:Uncharacterized protein n=1 Tax=Musa balbisiana TaxID=52838 RepID=A0A4S8KBY3_MUSBA|nr:hypothetical protein C4D60_Mb04t14150 [Musa balbisiana]